MKLGRAVAYAVLATIHLAERNSKTPVQGKDIAESCGIPTGHLLKILQQLVRAQILRSERGPAGGFGLRRPAKDITLLDIIEAIEGPIASELPLRNIAPESEPVRARLEEACQRVADYAASLFAKMSLADLAR